jgi:hypothetical protein
VYTDISSLALIANKYNEIRLLVPQHVTEPIPGNQKNPQYILQTSALVLKTLEAKCHSTTIPPSSPLREGKESGRCVDILRLQKSRISAKTTVETDKPEVSKQVHPASLTRATWSGTRKPGVSVSRISVLRMADNS